MSVRLMAVQYVGDMLRLPVVNEGDMDKPFGSSVLERDVKRIVVNPFSDNPQTFVPELEYAKLREYVQYVADGVYEGVLCCNKCRFFDGCYNDKKKEHDGRGCQWLLWARELGIEVDDDD